MSGTPTRRAHIARWLFVGVVMPVAFAALDHWLLGRMFEARHDEDTAAMLAMAGLIIQIGVMGVLCGKLIEWPLLRWILFGWCWLLVDVQLLIAADTYRGHWVTAAVLIDAMFVAQLGLVTIWALLGTTAPHIRWPAALLLGGLCLLPLQRFEHSTTQTVSLIGLCLLLRWRGYRLERVPLAAETQAAVAAARVRWERASGRQASTEPLPEAWIAEASRKLEPRQFGLRHVLLWTTSLAVLLGAARALDALSWQGLLYWSRVTSFREFAPGILLAIVLIVAMWGALGEGPAWLRWAMVALISFGSGLLPALHTTQLTYAAYQGRRVYIYGETWWEWLKYFWQDWVQYVIAGALLFATLQIFRAIGYRLARPPRRTRTS